MQAFDYARVKSVDEAVALLAEKNGSARVLSGGTDLLVALREGRLSTELVVDVKQVPELAEMTYDPSGGLVLGAAVSCQRMYDDETVAAAYPGLMDSAHLIGGVQIQGRASLGGNLCNASPAADGIPALIAHAAVCTVAGPNGRRDVAVEDFCIAPGRTVLEPGEFLVNMRMPAPKPGFGAASVPRACRSPRQATANRPATYSPAARTISQTGIRYLFRRRDLHLPGTGLASSPFVGLAAEFLKKNKGGPFYGAAQSSAVTGCLPCYSGSISASAMPCGTRVPGTRMSSTRSWMSCGGGAVTRATPTPTASDRNMNTKPMPSGDTPSHQCEASVSTNLKW